MVNGSSVSGSKVWYQTITVTPNTDYAFSVWIESLAALNPASLKFSINNTTLGNNINAGNTACDWHQFYTIWNSGNATTAQISILNNNTIANGNDFALDDISFSRVVIYQDSIRISVSPPPIIQSIADTTVCSGSSVTLHTTGAANYLWSPVQSLSGTTSADPVATPAVTTRYTVAAYNTPGCVGYDTVNITVLPLPTITVTQATTVCAGNSVQFSAAGGDVYSWAPAATLSSATSPNPVANPAGSQTYHVTAKTANGCSATDSVAVTVVPKPVLQSLADTAICQAQAVVLTTSTNSAATYSWSPASGLSATNIASPAASPAATTDYIVTATTGPNCRATDTVRVTVLMRPAVTLTNDTTVCQGLPVQLSAAGAATYTWSPATGLSGATGNAPVALADTSIVYTLLATGSNGCSQTDFVQLTVRAKSVFAVQPGSFYYLPGSVVATNRYRWRQLPMVAAKRGGKPLQRSHQRHAGYFRLLPGQNL